jgi:hypothetical protein
LGGQELWLLFHLLASGQSVFFVNSTTDVFYFSSDGVQMTQAKQRRAIIETIKKSWVIVDVDESGERSCP